MPPKKKSRLPSRENARPPKRQTWLPPKYGAVMAVSLKLAQSSDVVADITFMRVSRHEEL